MRAPESNTPTFINVKIEPNGDWVSPSEAYADRAKMMVVLNNLQV